MSRKMLVFCLVGAALCAGDLSARASEVVLQYFGTTWIDIARKMPELAEAGYGALWLPPPQKASGGLSVGFDTCDRFDLGDKHRHGLATKYGTKTDLLHLMEIAHRFGIRVYFDNIMAHTGGFMPEGEPYDLNDLGLVPADFHLIRNPDGSYTKDSSVDYDNEWEVLYRNPFSWDIATDWGGNNNSFPQEGSTFPKWVGVRHPNNPEYYDFDHEGNHVGFGHVTREMLDNHPDAYKEEVNDFLMRSVRWLIHTTKCDGFRLDAVKHVRADFFGADGEGADSSNWGYTGQIQWQFNHTHGYSDWNNHRDTCFNMHAPRDDAMLFGEHLGSRDWFGTKEDQYLARGMRIANDDFLNAVKGNIGSSLEWMDQPGYGIYSGNPQNVAHYVMSHDNTWLWEGDRKQAHAVIIPREGLPIVYTDGYNQAGEPDWFPKPSHVPFLGQFGQPWMPALLFIRRHFGWGGHWPRYGAWDQISWVRGHDNSHEGAAMQFVLVKNYNGGREVAPDGIFNTDDIVYQYGEWGRRPVYVGMDRKFYDYESNTRVFVGEGDFAAFSFRLPEMPHVWGDWYENEIRPIMIYQNGQPAGRIWVPRKDGRDGDPAFNPYGLPDADGTDYTYYMPVPRVTQSTNLRFVARADGTAENIMMKLDGGIDLNAHLWPDVERNTDAGARDNPPALSSDLYLGFEQMRFVHRVAEKFASDDTAHNLWGSPGATSYECTIGTAGLAVHNPDQTPNDWDTPHGPGWLYHDPVNQPAQFSPQPQSAAGQAIQVEVEIGKHPAHADHRAFLYYTTDGTSWPEGSAGLGQGSTKVIELSWNRVTGENNHWWQGTIPGQADGTALRYKIGAYRRDVGSLFPWNMPDIQIARKMETLFDIDHFNAGTIQYFPHNNWNTSQLETGLREGFHVLRTKSFLNRDPAVSFPTFREHVQTFYYDTQRPSGRILWPQHDGEEVSGSYGFYLRTDMTVTEVWYQIHETAVGTRPWARAHRGQVGAPDPVHGMEQEWLFDYDNIAQTGFSTVTIKLREVSSSDDLSLGDEAGHFTTLTRELVTGGGDRIYVVEPASGATVGAGSNLVVRLSRSLWEGLSPQQQQDAFTLTVNDIAKTNVQKTIRYDIEGFGSDHEITFALPYIYNGNPDFSHSLRVTYQRGSTNLATMRQVYARAEGGVIPPEWEMRWGLEPGTLNPTGEGDYDDDGVLDYHEYLANTDPTDPDSYFQVEAAPAAENNALDLNFAASLNRNYYVWKTPSLTSSWIRVDTPIPGDGGIKRHSIDLEGIDTQFYRLQVTLPQP